MESTEGKPGKPEAQFKRLGAKLAELKAPGGGKRGELETGVESAWNELAAALERLKEAGRG
jgi:hypothetical protein